MILRNLLINCWSTQESVIFPFFNLDEEVARAQIPHFSHASCLEATWRHATSILSRSHATNGASTKYYGFLSEPVLTTTDQESSSPDLVKTKIWGIRVSLEPLWVARAFVARPAVCFQWGGEEQANKKAHPILQGVALTEDENKKFTKADTSVELGFYTCTLVRYWSWFKLILMSNMEHEDRSTRNHWVLEWCRGFTWAVANNKLLAAI